MTPKISTINELRKRIGEAGHNHITKNFSWAKAAETLKQVFERRKK